MFSESKQSRLSKLNVSQPWPDVYQPSIYEVICDPNNVFNQKMADAMCQCTDVLGEYLRRLLCVCEVKEKLEFWEW